MKTVAKILFTITILFSFLVPSFADDISDFQIEGMSVGDSLLDYFSKKEIKDNTNINYYTNNKYTSVEFSGLPFFEIYDAVEFNYKTDDKKYIIVSIAGGLFCEKNIENCNKKQKEIGLEISNMFKNAKKDVVKNKHSADKSGKSTTSQINFWLKSGEVVSIELIDWSEKITNEKGWTDNLSVVLYSPDFAQWLINDSQN